MRIPLNTYRQAISGIDWKRCPDLNQVMLDLIVEHQADIRLLMKSLSSNTSDPRDCGHVVADHTAQLQTTYGTLSGSWPC
jgi:hypothetical protein